MTYILHDYMHEIIDDCMDDLIIKSKICESYLETLCKILNLVLEHNVILNTKVYFWGIIRKPFGFHCIKYWH